MNALPTFSVIVVNYNYAAFVGAAIDSALAQEYPGDLVEIIVVDDGSTDASRTVLAGYERHPRVRVVLQENRGQAAGTEAGVAIARNDFICLLDSDDLFLPRKLARVAGKIVALGGAPDAFFLCHDIRIRDDSCDEYLAKSWLQTVGVDSGLDHLDPAALATLYPFAIPCGQVFGRTLLTRILGTMPVWAFRRGPDTAMCMAAMLATWNVAYLHESLAVYRVHASNESARIVDGEYRVGVRWRTRTPRLIDYLGQWVDVLDLSPEERRLRTDCVRRIERMGRAPSAGRRLREPSVAVTVLGQDLVARAASVESVAAQYHGAISCATEDGPADRIAAGPLSECDRIAGALLATEAEYCVLVRAGDALDRACIEQHLLWMRHGALVGASCCDVHVTSSAGALVHADVFAGSGAWSQPIQQVPPFATTLGQWVFPPLSACMIRRTALLDRLLACVDEWPADVRAAGCWLPLQFVLHTAGVLRIRESLCTVRLPDGAAATYGYLGAPVREDGSVVVAPVESGARWLEGFHRRERALFERWLPEAWHARFVQWIRQQGQ